MINKAAIIITVGLLNPLRVSERSRIPKRKRASIDIKATTSGGYLSQTKRAMVIARIANSKYIVKKD